MRTGYVILLAEVVISQPEKKKMRLKVLGMDMGGGVSYVELEGTGEFNFMQPHAPSSKLSSAEEKGMHYLRIGDEFARNFVSGQLNFPEVGDVLVVAVYQHKMEYYDITKQITEKEVLILGQLAKHNPIINRYDNIILDRSGAKIHFNHQWYDLNNRFEVGDDVSTNALTGHTTIVGSRFVVLSGKRFLPFGGLSHQMNDPSGKIIFPFGFDQDIKEKPIKDLFTRAIGSPPDYANIYTPNLKSDRDKLDGKKFLDPPVPAEGEDQKMHESGWKRLIKDNADEIDYRRASMQVVGNKSRSLAFAPDNKESDGSTAVNTGFSTNDIGIVNAGLPEGSEAIYEVTASGVFGKRRHVKGDGLVEEVVDGISIIIPATKPASVEAVKALFDNASMKAESGKFKVYVGSSLAFVVGQAGKIEYTGNLKVTGTIESTVKVITPEVGSS